MTELGWEIVGTDDQQLPFPKTIGDALRDLVRRRWKHHTAKAIEQRWELDPKTARNVVSGHASERSLTKAARAERWGLWMALGEELFGEKYEQHLHRLVEEAANVQQLRADHRATVTSLEERAAAVGLRPRAAAGEPRRRDHGGR